MPLFPIGACPELCFCLSVRYEYHALNFHAFVQLGAVIILLWIFIRWLQPLPWDAPRAQALACGEGGQNYNFMLMPLLTMYSEVF